MANGFPVLSPYYRPPYPRAAYPAPYPAYPRYGNPAYTGGPAYQTHLLSQLKQQMGGTVINTSREPVTLLQLSGKHDGDPVSSHVIQSPHYTGVSSLDNAVQRTGSVVGYVPQAAGNLISSSVKGGLFGGGASLALAGTGALAAKLLGKTKGLAWGILPFGVLAAGAFGGMVGGMIGFGKASYETFRDLKDIALGNREG